MHMRVDQTRHERLALAVNDLGLRRGDRAFRDFTNSVFLHQDMHVFADLGRHAVPEVTVLQHNAAHGLSPVKGTARRLMTDIRGRLVSAAWAGYNVLCTLQGSVH